MRTLIVGLGERGRKRALAAGSSVVASVDPMAEDALYRDVEKVPVGSFDAAVVCVAEPSRTSIVKALLNLNKHVLIDQPLHGNLGRLRELGGISRMNKLSLYTSYPHRFEPQVSALKQVVDSGTLGKIHLARLFHGTGNARTIRQTPGMDRGGAVLTDLGLPLLDLSQFLLGTSKVPFELWNCNRFENRSFDHIFFGSPGEPTIQIEATYLSWKNTFSIDILAENGSAHLQGLSEWGASSLTIRKRPASDGKPDEDTRIVDAGDPTLDLEFAHFQALTKTGGSNISGDIMMAGVISSLLRDAGPGFEE